MNAPLTVDEEIARFLRGITKRRVSRVFMYGLVTIAAGIGIVSPSKVLMDQSSGALSLVWAIAFGVASLTCMIGSIFDRWIAEYTMIPLLSSSFMMFGVAMIGQAHQEEAWRIVPYALFFGAYSLGLVARWRDVQSLLRVASHLEDQ